MTSTPAKESNTTLWQILRILSVILFAMAVILVCYLTFSEDEGLASRNDLQQLLWPLLFSLMMGGIGAAGMALWVQKRPAKERPAWFFPLLSALLTLLGLSIAYIFLGIWPVGERSCLLVDLHHQYAPLLAEYRQRLLGGESLLYSFEFGLGASFLPALGYYLASPLNLLLVLFPERLLAESIFIITIIKNMLIAAACATCLQYIYRRRTAAVAAVAAMYAMMMYVLAYSWCLMWLDVLIVLPLSVMGLEHLMRTGKYLPYVLSLAYALLANYYIAFMLCVFLVFYYFAYLIREKRTPEQNRKSLFRFAAGSLMGGGLAMVLVLPVFLALSGTSAAGASLPEMENYFDMFDLLGRQLYATSPTIRSGNLPNQYCGVAVLLLVPLFAMNRGIPRRRRVAYMGLLGVMAFSLILNQPNLIWHGLHAPNDLPYRFSFVYCFVLLLLSYEVLTKLRFITARQLVLAFSGALVYLVVEERFGNEQFDFKTIYVTLLLLAVYVGILALLKYKETVERAVYVLFLGVVMLEMTMNATRTVVKLNNNEHYTAHASYVDNATSESLRLAVEKMKTLAADNGANFSRMEFLPRRTCTDTALYQYPGITTFASSNSYRATRFMGSMGYAVNGVNSYMYKSFVPVTDSLFGIRYVTLDSEIAGHPQLNLLDHVSVTNEADVTYTNYIYENTVALPLGYRVNAAAKEWASSYYNPMESINSLYEAFTGNGNPVLVPMPIEEAWDSEGEVELRSDHGFYFDPEGSETAVFSAETDLEGQYFLYVDCRSCDDIRVIQGSNSWNVSKGEPYFIDAGVLAAGEEIRAEITSNTICSGNVYILRLDSGVFNAAMAKLSADGLTVTEFSDTHIEGTVNASAEGTMVITVPYDDGWTVKVDGKTVSTYGLDLTDPDKDNEPDPDSAAALLCFDIAAGEHTVTLHFVPKGLIPGAVISVLSLLILIAFVLFTGRRAEVAADTRFAPLFDTACLDTVPETETKTAPEPEPEKEEEP